MNLRTGDRQLIKELNIALAINVIRQHEPISRVEIAERTGLGRSTITGIINTLLRENLVTEIGSAESAAGRKPVLLTFNARALYAVGVKLAPRSVTVALVDLNAKVLHSEEIGISPNRGVEAVLGTVKEALEKTLTSCGVERDRLLGIGLVMPGVVDPSNGITISSYFLGWENIPIRDLLEQELDLPAYVDNDANAMALAEALYGAGRGASDLVALTSGVGIGAGIIIGGQIHRGARFNAGELGHMCVVKDGPLCGCGRRGCLEALAADAAVVRRAREAAVAGRAPLLAHVARGHVDLITREMVVEAAKDGDEGAREVLAETGRWLGLAAANVVNVLGPARVVVGGEATLEAGELILAPMREAMAETVFPNMPADLLVVQSSLGHHAWVQGAAALVLADAFDVPLRQQNTNAMARRVSQP